jgi:hypothetical protein
VDSTCRIVIWKLEVANHYARKAIESFEIDVLAEGDTIKICTKSGNSKLVGVNCPSEAGAMQKECGELGEPPGNAVSVISQGLCTRTYCPSSVIARRAFVW